MGLLFKKLSIRLLVIVIIFATGITVTWLWAVPRLRTVSTPGTLSAALKDEQVGVKDEQVAVPDEWKKLDIKDRVTLRLPEDMKPSELIGDSYAYREAYGNRDLEITIAYGVFRPQLPNQTRKPFDPCDIPSSLREEPTYHESFIDIDGRKAKLRINRYHQPKFILANVCFLKLSDKPEQLVVEAFCKDDDALETAQQIFHSIRFKDGK